MGCTQSAAEEPSVPEPGPPEPGGPEVTLSCGHCRQHFKSRGLPGSQVPCPHCSALNQIPDAIAPTAGKPSATSRSGTGLAEGLSTRSKSERRQFIGGAKTKDKLDEELNESGIIRRPCYYGLACYRMKDDHLSGFCHPDDDDYFLSLRKHKGMKTPKGEVIKGSFSTLKQCFDFMDPYQKGIIDDKELLRELSEHMDFGGQTVDTAWKALDDDGNGFASFGEFVQWATETKAIDLPVGLEPKMSDVGEESKPDQMECSYLGCRCKSLRRKGKDTKFCRCGHKISLHMAKDDSSMVSVPPYWTNKDTSVSFEQWIGCDNTVVEGVQKMMDASVNKVWTRDRGRDAGGRQKPVPSGFEVVQVRRNEHCKIWRKYALKKALIKADLAIEGGDAPPKEEFQAKTSLCGTPEFMQDEPLDTSCNEWFLWHGTSAEGAKSICQTDFKISVGDIEMAGSATGTLYGRGTYFAESCTKADEYAKEEGGLFTMLLCRVVGGRVAYTAEDVPDKDDLMHKVLHGMYDSVLGDREAIPGKNTFKEFIIYASDQAYPEMIVQYRRRM